MTQLKKTKKIDKKESVKKENVKNNVKIKDNNELSLPVYDLDGKESKNISLTKEIFKSDINDKLIAQSVRVYLFNQRQGTASTKTRGEVSGSTRKIYRQKGTGRARHGDIKAPIFVGGGVVGGPKPKDYSLKINKKQNKKAIFGSLSLQFKNNNILILNDDILSQKPKTKIIFNFLKKLNLNNKKITFILPKKSDNFILSIRNINNVDFITSESISCFKILNCQKLIFFEKSLNDIKKILLKIDN
ncbi:MAG: 50S ribosomal protein L4 [Patescibacteria group bacterium]|nr:50S ribosomal protein L4 [Patescibacteria group bacterium]